MGSPNKHEILKEFTKILWEIDPMFIRSADDPADELPPDEYGNEALSIFSRFSESALQHADDQAKQIDVARSIVKETFNFWFGGVNIEDDVLELVTGMLLRAYTTAYVDHSRSE